jgi:NADH-quinone oxidoreductase subunit L
MLDPQLLVSIALLLPLAGFLILLFLGQRMSLPVVGTIACGTVLLSFISFVTLLYNHSVTDSPPVQYLFYRWIPVQGIDATVQVHIDHLSLIMTLIITGIGFLIHVYSLGYMDHDRDYYRYFACLNFFIFAMLILVLASDLLFLFVGWEGVGLASYLLIGFYATKPSAAAASTKAFIVNRIGDAGFLIALLLTYFYFGTGDIAEILRRAPLEFTVGAPIMLIITLFFMCGAAGKSAQLPLHVWLPDAMEGPTPVSALIHAATMVTAGVYLVVRLHPLFLLAPTTMQIVGVIGGLTSLIAALSAMGQVDLKRVLAYSTISQLGLMFLACGAGAFYAAMFHLTTHAFVKALLFLSAGNVVHMMGGLTDMRKMGGLRTVFTKTHWLFLLGALALSGVPPLAAFFSKDLILEEEYLTGHYILFAVGITISVLTSFYMLRAYWLTFAGQSNVEPEVVRSTREAPAIMIAPLTVLALLSIVGGALGFSRSSAPLLESYLSSDDPTLLQHPASHGFELSIELLISIAASLLGLVVAIALYGYYSDRLGKPLEILRKAFYIDELYDLLLVRPLKALSYAISNFFEPKVFDGSISMLARGSDGVARQFQKVQSGQIRSYLAWMLLGGGLLLIFLNL